MDALISSELLTAIFLPTSPLHDGAVILQRERYCIAMHIAYEYTNIIQNTWYTTQAGVGITEKSNTIALIISEERKQIP